MRKAILMMAASALAFALAGCSGGNVDTKADAPEAPQPESTAPAVAESESSDPLPLELIETGYSVSEDGYVFYGVGIKNPNTNFEAEFPVIQITGKDADGKIVFSDDQTLMFMLPGAEYYFGGQAGNGTKPEIVEFSASTSKDNWIPNDKQSMAIYDISNANEVVGEFGDVSYTGELTVLEEWDDVTSACVNVILRNEAGEIVYGDYTFVELPSSGESAPFELHAYDVPDHASYEIYAQPW